MQPQPPQPPEQQGPATPIEPGYLTQPGYPAPPDNAAAVPPAPPEGRGQLVPPAQPLQAPPRQPPVIPPQPTRPTAPNATGQQREPSGTSAPVQPERQLPGESARSNAGAPSVSAPGIVPDNEALVPPVVGAPSAMDGVAQAQPTGQERDLRTAPYVALSTLMGRPIVDLTTGRRVGQVDNVVLSTDHRTVEAFTSRGGFLRGAKAYPARGANIGEDAITLPPGVLDRFDARSVRGLPLARTVAGKRLLSETGRALGTINDIRMAPHSAEVLGYDVDPEDRGILARFMHHTALLPVAAIQRRGADAWIVGEHDAQQYFGG